MNTNVMFKIQYGLFVLTAREGDKDNGCIINTASQVTSTPCQISIAVNKDNYTHDMIQRTKEFNVSVIAENATFELFQHFGFQSGKNVDKFQNYENAERSENGIYYVTEGVNSFISARVVSEMDMGTHTIFGAVVTGGEVLTDTTSTTYNYYQKNIKPAKSAEQKTGWLCTVCGYVYEGDPLPEGYICPICKHGVEAFEKIK
ncbi:MAG: flavin reductase [Lachnospiraceae bacterium]|jgi:flavin reductase (DIM6/NTAB) family NADH-FMN oxidoreductase RutF|nr:flavin reductase [Lachnospiraceae bacterium]